MLSLETPPSDLCCPSSQPSLRTEIRTSDPEQFPIREADPKALYSGQKDTNFRIRDYVLTSRSTDIKTTWPFHLKTLQVCLKHGVKNLLPPFEPPDLVRGQSHGNSAEQNYLVSCPESKQNSPEGLSNGKHGFCGPSACFPQVNLSQVGFVEPDKSSLFIASKDDEGTPGERTDYNSIPGLADELEAAGCSVSPHDLEKLSNCLEKKSRVIFKLNTQTDSASAEDPLCNSTMVSNPMASKTCPICKMFSSTSNTTLNAHIDQCLFSETGAAKPADDLLKIKVKPRKKKSMVEIYATALSCTLEDLDRRNGTNWAAELAISVEPKAVLSEEKISEASAPQTSKTSDKVGPVYVDSNGIKIRILSNAGNSPAPLSREKLKLQEDAKRVSSKKLGFRTLNTKKKWKIHAKKFNRLNLSECKVQNTLSNSLQIEQIPSRQRNVHDGSHRREISARSSSELIGQWASAKRSHLKFMGKKNALEHIAPEMNKEFGDDQHKDSEEQDIEECCERASSSREDLSSTVMHSSRWSSRASSSDDHLPRVSSSGTVAKRKGVEICVVNMQEKIDVREMASKEMSNSSQQVVSAKQRMAFRASLPELSRKSSRFKMHMFSKVGRKRSLIKEGEHERVHAAHPYKKLRTRKFSMLAPSSENTANQDYWLDPGGTNERSGDGERAYSNPMMNDAVQSDGNDPETRRQVEGAALRDHLSNVSIPVGQIVPFRDERQTNKDTQEIQSESNLVPVREHNLVAARNDFMGFDAQETSSITSSSHSANHDDCPISTSNKLVHSTHDSDMGNVTHHNLSSSIPPLLRADSNRVQNPEVADQEKTSDPANNVESFQCSCKETLTRESKLLQPTVMTGVTAPTSKVATVRRLQICPRTSSSFISYQSPRADGTELPTQLTKVSSDAESPSSSTMNQLPSPSNPVLRLMGKNLLITSNGDMAQPQNPVADYDSLGNYMPPIGNSNDVLEQENVHFRCLGTSPFTTVTPLVNFMARADQSEQLHQRNHVRPAHPPYVMKEVILIDNSPATALATTASLNPQRPMPFVSIPSVGPRPLFTNLNPAECFGLANCSSTSEGAISFLPWPYVYTPTAPSGSNFYYPHTLR